MKWFEKVARQVFVWIAAWYFVQIFGTEPTRESVKGRLRNLQEELDRAYEAHRTFCQVNGKDGTEWDWALPPNHPISLERRRLHERIGSLHKEFDFAHAVALMNGRGFKVKKF
jgi:hypothetical protein